MRAAGLLALLLLAPVAAADVDVRDVQVPARTMAGLPFEASVTVANTGPEARTVYLLAALYQAAEGQGPCGSATDPRFRAFTPLLQAELDLAPGAVVAYPSQGERWLQRYDARHVAAEPRVEEWCVFAAEDRGQQLEYLDFEAVPLSVRGVNARPTADFSWSPERPREAEDVVFEATGEDADGDPVTFSWDFGHANASGRAVAQGPRATHFFYPAAQYTVTLRASDGLQDTPVLRNVRVLAEGPASGDGEGNGTPLPVALTLAAALLAARSRSRRRG